MVQQEGSSRPSSVPPPVIASISLNELDQLNRAKAALQTRLLSHHLPSAPFQYTGINNNNTYSSSVQMLLDTELVTLLSKLLDEKETSTLYKGDIEDKLKRYEQENSKLERELREYKERLEVERTRHQSTEQRFLSQTARTNQVQSELKQTKEELSKMRLALNSRQSTLEQELKRQTVQTDRLRDKLERVIRGDTVMAHCRVEKLGKSNSYKPELTTITTPQVTNSALINSLRAENEQWRLISREVHGTLASWVQAFGLDFFMQLDEEVNSIDQRLTTDPADWTGDQLNKSIRCMMATIAQLVEGQDSKNLIDASHSNQMEKENQTVVARRTSINKTPVTKRRRISQATSSPLANNTFTTPAMITNPVGSELPSTTTKRHSPRLVAKSMIYATSSPSTICANQSEIF